MAFAHSVRVPECANKFPSRVFRKSICEIFLPPMRKKELAVQNGQVKQMEEELLCPLPCETVVRIRICHSVSLIYISPCDGCNPPQLAASWPYHFYRRNYPLLLGHGFFSKYVRRVCPSTAWLVTPSSYLKVAPCHSLGA